MVQARVTTARSRLIARLFAPNSQENLSVHWSMYCPEDIKHLPSELVDYARRQIVNATLYKGDERRLEGRYPMILPVRAVAVDEHYHVTGETFHLITREVSATGIGLLHTERIDADYLALNFSVAGVEVNLIARVIWSAPQGPFYGAGGRFDAKLEAFPGTC